MLKIPGPKSIINRFLSLLKTFPIILGLLQSYFVSSVKMIDSYTKFELELVWRNLKKKRIGV